MISDASFLFLCCNDDLAFSYPQTKKIRISLSLILFSMQRLDYVNDLLLLILPIPNYSESNCNILLKFLISMLYTNESEFFTKKATFPEKSYNICNFECNSSEVKNRDAVFSDDRRQSSWQLLFLFTTACLAEKRDFGHRYSVSITLIVLFRTKSAKAHSPIVREANGISLEKIRQLRSRYSQN